MDLTVDEAIFVEETIYSFDELMCSVTPTSLNFQPFSIIGGRCSNNNIYIKPTTSKGYLEVDGPSVLCRQLKKGSESFKYRTCTYKASTRESIVLLTVNPGHQSPSGKKHYLCTEDENTVEVKELDEEDYNQTIPDDDPRCFIRKRYRPGAENTPFYLESVKYPGHYLYVAKNGVLRLCLRKVSNNSELNDDFLFTFERAGNN